MIYPPLEMAKLSTGAAPGIRCKVDLESSFSDLDRSLRLLEMPFTWD